MGNKKSSNELIEPERPDSPPRDLVTILKSNVLTNDFRTYLADIDEDAGDNDNLRVTWLNFLLSCRKLDELSKSKSPELQDHLQTMNKEFFSKNGRVALSSQALWTECQKVCKNKRSKTSDLGVLWKAHDDVLTKVDKIYQPFLLQNHIPSSSLPDVIQQCLL